MRTADPGARAFSLVEVSVALGVAGFCLVAVLGLLPVSLASNAVSTGQTTANGIVTAVTADLRATPPGTAATSQQYQIAIPTAGTAASQSLYFNDDGVLVTTVGAATRRLDIAFAPSLSGGGLRTATCATMRVSWPAAVDPSKATPSGCVTAFIALDRN